MTVSDLVPLGLAWLGTYLVHSTLLLGSAWLLTRIRWFSVPHLSERLWRVGLLGGLLTASMQVGLGYDPLLGSLHLAPSEELAALRSSEEVEIGSEREDFEDKGALSDLGRISRGPSLLRNDTELAPFERPIAQEGSNRPLESAVANTAVEPFDTAGDRRPTLGSLSLAKEVSFESRDGHSSRDDRSPRNRSALEAALSPSTGNAASEREARIATLSARASEARARLQKIVTRDADAGVERQRFEARMQGDPQSSEASRGLTEAQPTQLDEGNSSEERHGACSLAESSNAAPLGVALGRISTAVGKLASKAPWRIGLVGMWVAIAGLGLLGFLWAAARLGFLLSDKRELTSGPLREQLDQLRVEAGAEIPVRLFASDTLLSPITYGWIDRRICVPTRVITELSASQTASLLAHELAHAVRRDPLWFSAYTLIERLFFFQPLNRLARRSLQDSAELLCDEWSVRWTGGRLALASCLTEIAQWIVGRRAAVAGVPGMASRPSQLGRRVERLLDEESQPAPRARRRWWLTSASAGLGLVVFAVPGVSSQPSSSARSFPSFLPNRASLPVAPAIPIADPRESNSAPDPQDADRAHEEPDLYEPDSEPSTAVLPTTGEPTGLTVDSELLSVELVLLDREVDDLREELRATEQYPRFERALSLLEDRIASLHERRQRLHALLTLVSSNLVPDRDAEPASDIFPKD